jgi:hypothetical protein
MFSPDLQSTGSSDVLSPADSLPGLRHVLLPPTTPAHLFVIVDTEEEFDWEAPLSRANTSVRAIGQIDRLQRVMDRFRITPTYVVDFPVASQRDGFAPIKDIADSGQARIGAHLHPWVNPPFVEEVSARNSYGCRLGEALETEKIRVLKAEIANRFNCVPVVFKAGRYGFGPTTAAALEALSFTIDVSVNPRMDFSSDGGPSFQLFDSAPFFFGQRRRLLELPCSTDYVGFSRNRADRLHRVISHPAFRRVHLVGVMARLGVVNKIMLSPEGSTLSEMKALTRSLLEKGVRTFSLTMHSPSVEPGSTPYVRTTSELRTFIDRITAYCEFFLGDLGGVASTPEVFRDSLDPESETHK